MSRAQSSQRSIRARRDEELENEIKERENEDIETGESGSDGSNDTSNETETTVSDEDSNASSEEESPSSSLQDITFGALAKAQESLAPPIRPCKRKRTLDIESAPLQPNPKDAPDPHRPTKPFQPSKAIQHRTSKHAPQTLSTRHAVPRARTILAPSPSLKSRDPRFDPPTLNQPSRPPTQDAEKTNQNYSFLTTYRQSELQALQAELKAALHPPRKQRKGGAQPPPPSVDADTIARLKREIMSLGAKLASSETRTRELEILRAHKRKEREAIREGRKSQPYYLKRGEVRKEVEREKVQGLGKRAREKRELRRGKREKGREGRGLPRVRRGRVAAGEGS